MRHKNIPFLTQNFPLSLPEIMHSGGALFLFSRYNIIRKQQPVTQMAGIGGMDMQKKLFTASMTFIKQSKGQSKFC